MEQISPSELDLKERVVNINRVAKVVKGGRRFSFNSIVVVGDGKGHVGVGFGKANEVTDAITKSTENARKNLVFISINKGTVSHPIIGKYGAARVFLKPASPGTGVIAGGPVRAIMESVGISDVLAKILGSTNPHNVVKATMNALENMLSVNSVTKKRGISVREMFLME